MPAGLSFWDIRQGWHHRNHLRTDSVALLLRYEEQWLLTLPPWPPTPSQKQLVVQHEIQDVTGSRHRKNMSHQEDRNVISAVRNG